MAETGRTLGISMEKLHGLLARGLIKGVSAGDWWGAPILIERCEVEKLAPDGRPLIRLDEVGRQLGLSRHRQIQFVVDGVITPFVGPIVDGSKVYLLRANAAEEILNDFDKHLDTSSGGSPLWRFEAILRGSRKRQVPLRMLMGAIRSGRLRPVGKNEEKLGLNAFLFNRYRSILVLRELEAAHRAESGADLSPATVAGVLGISQDAVYEMLDAGFLSGSKNSCGSWIVTFASITAFRKNYVKTSEIADKRKTTWAYVRKRLKQIGIEPSSGEIRNTSFFERSVLETVDLERLLS